MWTPNVDSRLLLIQMYTQEEITLNINFLSSFLVSLRLVNRHDPKKKISAQLWVTMYMYVL